MGCSYARRLFFFVELEEKTCSCSSPLEKFLETKCLTKTFGCKWSDDEIVGCTGSLPLKTLLVCLNTGHFKLSLVDESNGSVDLCLLWLPVASCLQCLCKCRWISGTNFSCKPKPE